MAGELMRPIGMKIALVTNIPRPYRIPLYETLSRKIAEAGGEFKVFFYSDQRRHVRRQGVQAADGQYASESVVGFEFVLGYERIISVPTRVLPALRAYRPDVVISGTFGPAGYLTWLYTRAARIPYIQWSGATLDGQRGGSAHVSYIQSFLVRRAQVCLAYGTAARSYLLAAGAQTERVVVGINTVDTAFYSEQAKHARAQAIQLKAEQGLAGINLLYVGNLVERKGIGHVLESLGQLHGEVDRFSLHVVGAGPIQLELQTRATALGLSERTRFWGTIPTERLPLFYALADVFVFPSLDEIWGLVLNEAMSSGLPAIASSLAGATRDLVEDGVNGLVVDPRDIQSLADALERLIVNSELRARLGSAAAASIQQKATIEHSADAFMRAIDLALEQCSSQR